MKHRSLSFSLLVLTKLFVFLLLGFSTKAHAITVSGTLYTNTQWTKAQSPVIVTGDLTVNTGVTLTIDPGVEVLFRSSDGSVSGNDTARVELILNGSLVANGTSNERIQFRCETGTTRGCWYGIRIATNVNATLSHALIRDAQYGLYLEGSATSNVTDTEITNTAQYAVYASAGSIPTLTRANIHRNSNGVYTNNAKLTMRGSLVYRNTSTYAVYVSSTTASGETLLDNNTITLNTYYGLYTNVGASGGTVTVQNNILSKNYSTSTDFYNASTTYMPTCKNNLIWDTSGTTVERANCTDTTVYNPLFVNETTDDFRLYDRSPARKAGINGVDLGAFQWTAQVTNVLHGKLFQDLTLPAGDYTLTGDLLVPPGITLTLQAGARISASTDDMVGGADPARAEIVVQGNLIAQGTSSQRAELKGASTSRGIWYGIRVLSGGKASFRDVLLRDGQYGASAESSGILDASDIEITNTAQYAFYASSSAELSLVRGKVHRNTNGLYSNNATTRITFTQIYRNTSTYAVYISSTNASGLTLLDHNTITLNTYYGLYTNVGASGGIVTVQNNILSKNYSASTDFYNASTTYMPTCKNNLIWDTSGTTVERVTCTNTVISNPLFVNETTDDFNLTSNSPARQKGTDGSDLGALPFQPILAQIVVTPTPANLVVGQSQQFTAIGYDSNGSQVNGLTFTWALVNGGGTLSATGLFTANTTAKTYTSTIEATSGSIKGYATVNVLPGPTTKVEVLPTKTTVKAGESAKVTARITDQYGNIITNKSVAWTATPNAGTITSDGTLSAGTIAGTYPASITATVDGVSGTGDVEIIPNDLNKLEVSPNPAQVQINKTQQFSVVGKDRYNNTLATTPSVTWAVIAGGGTIDPTGLFTANTTPGTFANTVEARSGNIRGYATVEVTPSGPAVASVTVTPVSATLQPNGQQLFTASAYDSNNQRISGTSFSWSLPGGGGSIAPSGGLRTQATFTAGTTEGTFTVTATAGGINGNASVIIKKAATLAKINVSPATATLKVNAQQTFTATGEDTNGQPIALGTVTWSASSGTITQVGLYTAPNTAGSVTVTAESNGIKGIASLQITQGQAPTAPTLTSPANAATATSLTPALTLTNSTDADGDKLTYTFEVATDANFAQKIASQSVPETPNTTQWTVTPPLQENKTYYWRAQASDGSLQSPWSAVFSFTVNAQNDPPTAPALSSPVDGGQVASLQPTLEVTNATDPEASALVYRFEIATDKNFQQVLSRSAAVTEGRSGATSWKVDVQLTDNTLYYWRAKATDTAGADGPWMNPASFTVSLANKAPSAPQPRKPKDADTVSTNPPDFEVINSIDPDNEPVTLAIEVDTVKTFDSTDKIAKDKIAQDASGITTWKPAAPLKENTAYFWRTRASDGKTTTPWVFGGEFFVNSKNDLPTAPILQEPTNGNTLPSIQATLRAAESSDPDKDKLTYHFQLSTQKDFSNDVIENNQLLPTNNSVSWQPAGLEAGKTYHWRARAHDGKENGPWSDTWTFHIQSSNPSETHQEAKTNEPTDDGGTNDGNTNDSNTNDGNTNDGNTNDDSTNDGNTNDDSTKEIGQSNENNADTKTPGGGCGCQGSSPSSPAFFLFFLLIFALRQRRSPKPSPQPSTRCTISE
ncbi:MYXO-CTERM sorting domain-containing protein [Myxococcota bacterium]|nr:MYXO-CTERM sorting domain-containing protein [Myxococcota bacterium]